MTVNGASCPFRLNTYPRARPRTRPDREVLDDVLDEKADPEGPASRA